MTRKQAEKLVNDGYAYIWDGRLRLTKGGKHTLGYLRFLKSQNRLV